MSSRRTVVPSIPEIAQSSESIDRALRTIKEAVEVGYGRRGDALDRFVTLRDLREGNVARVTSEDGGRLLGLVPIGVPGAELPDEIRPPDYGDDDYTVPLRPKNVKVRSLPPEITEEGGESISVGSMMVTWDPPGYGNHYFAEIYRSTEAVNIGPDGNGMMDGLNVNYPYGFELPSGSPNELLPSSKFKFAGVASGTIFTDTGLDDIPGTGATELDRALNPGRYYYWVRFVSRALVTGPFSDRASDTLAINPALVLDLMTRNITNSPIFSHLREWLALGSDASQAYGSILEYMDTAISESGISSIWSVRMAHSVDGHVAAAGFGLGLETTQNDDGSWSSVSTFLINANQFAIMGPNTTGGGARILSWAPTPSSNVAVLTLSNSYHGFTLRQGTASDPYQRAVLAIPDADIRTELPDGTTLITPIPGTLTSLAGVEVEVIGVSGNQVTIRSGVDGGPSASLSYNGSFPVEWGLALMPAQNVPFIVDATRNTVAVRGSLIVHGLVRANEAVFDQLSATTAFVKKLQTEVLNANVVIGQRIIAGVGSVYDHAAGPISTVDYNNVQNYVVELNNPSTSPYAIRMWKPSTGHEVFTLNSGSSDPSKGGNVYIGGNITIGGSGVIAGDKDGILGDNSVIFSTGGSGADTGAHTRYALWIGPKGAYGGNGLGRKEGNGVMWVKSDGRAGFNAKLFLGTDPLAVPSGNGFITVEPKRDGGNARVFVSATFSVIGEQNANCQIGADLYLMPHNYSSPGHGPVRGGVGFDPSPEQVGRHAGWFGNQGHAGPQLTSHGGYRVCGTQLDSRQGSSDVKSRALQGSIVVPAGTYKVFLALWEKQSISGSSEHGCFSMHPFALQVSNDPPASRGTDDVTASAAPPIIETTLNGSDWIVASEDITMGAFVNIYDDGGYVRIRNADASLGHMANGWIRSTAHANDRVHVERDGINSMFVGLSVAQQYALSDTQPGGVDLASNIQTGNPVQIVGIALSDSDLQVGIQGDSAAWGSDAHYEHVQSSPSATWNITHGLGKEPSVTVVNSAGDVILSDVIVIDSNSVTVKFSAPFSGKAYLN